MRNYMFFLTSLFMSAFIMSCQNDELKIPSVNECEEMLYFESFEDCYNEINLVLQMNEEELKRWENENGFKSFRLDAERFYKNIDPSKFSDVEAVKKFVSENSNFLQLVPDDNGEYELDIKLLENKYSYIANADGLFQVGDKVCKVYDEAVIAVDEQSVDLLKNATMDEALAMSNMVISKKVSFEKSTQAGCASDVDRSTDGGERIRLKIGAYIDDFLVRTELYPGAGVYRYVDHYKVIPYYQARPYNRVLGIWYHAKRTISCDIKLNYKYYNPILDEWDTCNRNYANSGFRTWVLEDYSYVDYFVDEEPSISIISYDGWAKQPNVDEPAELSCGI